MYPSGSPLFRTTVGGVLLAGILLIAGCDSSSDDGGFTDPTTITVRVSGTPGVPYTGSYRYQTFETCATSEETISGEVPASGAFTASVTANAAEISAVHMGASGQLLVVEVERNGVVLSDQTNVSGGRATARFPFQSTCN